MADWNLLKPLKTHANFMTIIVLGLGAILIFTPRNVFKSKAEDAVDKIEEESSIVSAVSGLSIRDEPTIHGHHLKTAPFQSSLIILDKNAAQDKISGEDGNWYKVEYDGVVGYAWGNYIGK